MSRALSTERRIDHGQGTLALHVSDLPDAQHAPERFDRDPQRPRRRRRTGRRLGKGGRAGRVEADGAFHLLHDLVDVTIQDRDRPEPTEIPERLLAVLRGPTPLRSEESRVGKSVESGGSRSNKKKK